MKTHTSSKYPIPSTFLDLISLNYRKPQMKIHLLKLKKMFRNIIAGNNIRKLSLASLFKNRTPDPGSELLKSTLWHCSADLDQL